MFNDSHQVHETRGQCWKPEFRVRNIAENTDLQTINAKETYKTLHTFPALTLDFHLSPLVVGLVMTINLLFAQQMNVILETSTSNTAGTNKIYE